MVPMVAIGSASISRAAEVYNCQESSIKTALGEYRYRGESDRIENLQKQLLKIGYDPIEIDGFAGRNTIAALKKFCDDFEIRSTKNLADDLVEAIRHYAAIAKEYPRWQEIVSSDDFKKWLGKQSVHRRIHIRKIMRSGTALLVTSLLNDVNHHEDAPAIQDWESSATDDEPSQPESNDESGVFYRLTQDDLEKLKTREAILDQLEELKTRKAILDRLKELEDVKYASETELVDAVTAKIQEATDDYTKYLPIIAHTIQRLPRQSADENAIEPLNGSDYVQKSELPGLVRTILEEQYPPLDPNHAEKAYRLTDEFFQALNANPEFRENPDTILKKLESLLGVAYVNQRLYETAVRSALDMEAFEESKKEFVQAVVTEAREEGKAKAPLQLTAAECGCARQWDSVGKHRFTVYGFYPFWMSARDTEKADPDGGDDPSGQADGESNKKHGGDAVDFSVLTRIGYFALELGKDGIIAGNGHWKDGAKDFIKTAHRYRSEVDLVIEARGWEFWEDRVLEQAVESIWDQLDPKGLPDGVTIYFPHFSGGNRDQQKNIVKLVKKLHRKLNPEEDKRKRGPLRKILDALGREKALSLNILIDAGNLKDNQRIDPTGVHGLLGGLKDILVGDSPKVDLVLVLFDRPVTKMKKRLRLAVENQFEGQQRRDVLRKIVPVIAPNGHREKEINPNDSYELGSDHDPFRQLQHDLVYFRDNFRGVAFWPAVPTASDEKDLEDLKYLQNRLVRTFAQSQETGTTRHGSAREARELPAWNFCVYVCPNRATFLIAFSVLLGLLILLALLAYWSCEVRSALAKRLLSLLGGVALLIAIFLALITCDPIWNEQESKIQGALVVLLIGSWLFHYIRKVKQGPLP
jgi:hypothetical protein